MGFMANMPHATSVVPINVQIGIAPAVAGFHFANQYHEGLGFKGFFLTTRAAPPPESMRESMLGEFCPRFCKIVWL